MEYNKIPSPYEFKVDTKDLRKDRSGTQRDYALERLDALLSSYQQLPYTHSQNNLNFARATLLRDITLTATHWVHFQLHKRTGRFGIDSKPATKTWLVQKELSLGGQSVDALRRKARMELARILNITELRVFDALVRKVDLEKHQRDKEQFSKGKMVYLGKDSASHQLIFRDKLAYFITWWDLNNPGALEPADTEDEHFLYDDNYGPAAPGMAGFVLTWDRVFLIGRHEFTSSGTAFKHSSYLKGAPVLMAGDIGIKKGQVRFISSGSGHYRPSAKNMLYALEALKMYGVDLSTIMISARIGEVLNPYLHGVPYYYTKGNKRGDFEVFCRANLFYSFAITYEGWKALRSVRTRKHIDELGKKLKIVSDVEMLGFLRQNFNAHDSANVV